MKRRKLILFLGSPRKHGYTTTLAREAGRGAAEAGLEVKEYDLNDSGIRGCQGCYHCRETHSELASKSTEATATARTSRAVTSSSQWPSHSSRFARDCAGFRRRYGQTGTVSTTWDFDAKPYPETRWRTPIRKDRGGSMQISPLS